MSEHDLAESSREWPLDDNKSYAKTLYEGESKCHCCINWVEEYPPDLAEPSNFEDDGSHALILRYAKSHKPLAKNPLRLYSITITSEVLKTVVRNVLERYPGISTHVEDLTFTPPFEPFFHRWTQLLDALEVESNELAQKHIGLLIDTLKRELGPDIKRAKELLAQNEVDFRLLWTIFPPGSAAFGKIEDHEQAFLVSGGDYQEGEAGKMYLLDLAFLDFDGKKYGWRQEKASIIEFKGTRKIRELHYVPKQFVPLPAEVFEEHTQRGKKAQELCVGGYKAHRGIIAIPSTFGTAEKFSDGRIVIDPLAFSNNQLQEKFPVAPFPSGLGVLVDEKYTEADVEIRPRHSGHMPHPVHDGEFENLGYSPHPAPLPPVPFPQGHLMAQVRASKAVSSLKDTTADSSLESNKWTEEVVDLAPEAFCRCIVRGYCLASKVWAEFHVDNIRDIEWNDAAFDKVVMSAPRKTLLRAVMEEQKKNKTDCDDFVEGKGQGLVMLFSGPPGTGKTLTAESIADKLRLPLYHLGAGQLGHGSPDIEGDLNRVFGLAASWEAILLLDEADAFLERRMDDFPHYDRNRRVACKLACPCLFHSASADPLLQLS